MKTKSFRKP